MTEEDNGLARKQKAAIEAVRRRFRRECHRKLDEYLSEQDPETEMPCMDMIIAYAGQGWAVSVGISLQEPGGENEDGAGLKPKIEIIKA